MLGFRQRSNICPPQAFDRVVTHLADALAELSVPDPTIEEIAGALAPLRPEIVSVGSATTS